MLYLFLAFAAIFIIIIPIFLKIIKTGKLTSTIVNPLVLSFGIILFILPFIPQPRLHLEEKSTLIVTILSFMLAAIGFYLIIDSFIVFKKYRIPLAPYNWTPPRIVDRGVYRLVRHPQYLGGLLAYGGLYLFMKGLYSLCLIYPLLVVTLYIRAYAEEKYILVKQFPNEYTNYQKKVGMFIPKFKYLCRESKNFNS
jgi:protein-S-isoprenylcysteine O-methyltransferase Ste14